jgi:hypothetical protein
VARNARLLTLAGALLAVCLVAAGSGSAAAPVTNDALLVEHWDGIAWTQQATPNGEDLFGVAALSPKNVWAVGRSLVSRNLALAVHWDGSSWQPVPVPKPKKSASILLSVAARSGDDVWAVGYSQKNGVGPERPLIERWNGSAWRIVASPHPRATSQLSGVAVLSRRNAWAVGSSNLPSHARTLIEHWNGTRWRIVPSRITVAHGNGELSGVAAVSPGNVWAVGQSGARQRSHALVLNWNGERWSRVRSPAPGVGATLFSVAAPRRRDVWAVGDYRTAGNSRTPHAEQPLAEHWDGRSWQAIPAPSADSQSLGQALTAVAVGPGGNMWAAGLVLHGRPLAASTTFEQTVLERWNGTSWALVTPPEPASRGAAFYGLAALPSGEAWAVGWTGGPQGSFR